MGFGLLDWAVVVGLLALTTIVGERLAGKQASMRDFFLGGRRLPWYAVAASFVATEVSAVTFVGIPYVVFKAGGDLTFLQVALVGAFLARVVVAVWLVPAYYEHEVFSPYDYMGRRLGDGVRRTASALFAVGGVLAQCARVYVTAVVLEVVLARELGWLAARTGLPPLVSAVGAIGLVSVVWTWIGGIATVVWTDAILFLVFLGGLAVALGTALSGIDGGLGAVWEAAREAGKLRVLDLDPSPTKSYTLLVALVAAPWWFAGVYGTDQLFVQRVLCCRDVRSARLAVLTSQVVTVVTLLAMGVGLALFAWYQRRPLAGEARALYEANGDRIFPIFVMQEVPAGLKGLFLAGVLAAAISSLDSIMAALSQTALATVWLPRVRRRLGLSETDPLPPEVERRSVRVSRLWVLGWGVALCALAVAVRAVHERYGSILDMALAMAGYTTGALLAGFVLALRGRRDAAAGFVWSAPLSVLAVLAVAWHQPAARWVVLAGCAALALVWLAVRGPRDRATVELGVGLALVLALEAFAYGGGPTALDPDAPRRVLAYPWYVPLGSLVALVFAIGLRPGRGAGRAHVPGAGA